MLRNKASATVASATSKSNGTVVGEIPEGMVEHIYTRLFAVVTNPHKHAVTLQTGTVIPSKEAVEIELAELRENQPWINGQGLDIEEKAEARSHLKPAPVEVEDDG